MEQIISNQSFLSFISNLNHIVMTIESHLPMYTVLNTIVSLANSFLPTVWSYQMIRCTKAFKYNRESPGEPAFKPCCATWGSQPVWTTTSSLLRFAFNDKRGAESKRYFVHLKNKSKIIDRVLLKCFFPVRKMPHLVRPGADGIWENVGYLSRFLHAPLLWFSAEQEWHLGYKIRMKERPLELRHASRSEITGVINIPVPAEPLQLLQPG